MRPLVLPCAYFTKFSTALAVPRRTSATSLAPERRRRSGPLGGNWWWRSKTSLLAQGHTQPAPALTATATGAACAPGRRSPSRPRCTEVERRLPSRHLVPSGKQRRCVELSASTLHSECGKRQKSVAIFDPVPCLFRVRITNAASPRRTAPRVLGSARQLRRCPSQTSARACPTIDPASFLSELG